MVVITRCRPVHGQRLVEHDHHAAAAVTGMHCRHGGSRATSYLAAAALGVFACGVMAAAQTASNTATVGNSAQFAAALSDSSVGIMLLNGALLIFC